MTCDIFIRTHPPDAAYHEKCLASIAKYCSGFRDTVVVNVTDPSPKAGYLAQQVDKLHADLHTDAGMILFMDSDTLFTRPVTPETFLCDAKPIWLHTPWTPGMLAHPGTRAWFDVMTEFAGEMPPSEMMRRHPFMVPAWLLKDIREWCQLQHRMPLGYYIREKGRFSEFNVMGFHAWRFHRDKFHWIDTSKDELPELAVFQMWSHDPISVNMARINEILQ